MKQRIPLLTALVAVASTGMALGCGCSSVRMEPVRELIVHQPSTCWMETRSTVDWGAPFRAVGSVISAPFVAIGSALSPSYRYAEPGGERLVYTRPLYRSTTLMPVGERFTTVKIIRSRTLLEPVGERFIITKHHCYSKSLKPVGERFIITKHHTKMLKPVGEKLTIHKKVMLKPGQNLRVYSQKW